MIQICGKNLLITGRLVRVARLDGEGYDSLDNPEEIQKECQNSEKRIDLFTFVQKLSSRSPAYSYPLEWENFAVLPISTFDHWMANQIDFKVRNKIRKSTKNGLTIEEVPFSDDLVRGISAIYNETPTRQGRSFPHYGINFNELKRMKSTFLDRSIFIGAFSNRKLVGFIKLVTNEERSQAGLMHILSMVQHRDKAPTNALIAHAVRICAERGIPYLWYANFEYGTKKADSLAEFKRHNGFEKVEIPRYYIPLTPIGRLSLRYGLHHNATELIPESVAGAFRRIRASWYASRSLGKIDSTS